MGPAALQRALRGLLRCRYWLQQADGGGWIAEQPCGGGFGETPGGGHAAEREMACTRCQSYNVI